MADDQQRRIWERITLPTAIAAIVLIIAFVILRANVAQSEYESRQLIEDCVSDYAYLLQNESYGHNAQNSHVWADFSVDCPSEVEALSAYLAARETVRSAGNDCAGLHESVDATLLAKLESYGECDGVPLADQYEAEPQSTNEPISEPRTSETPAKPVWPGGDAISWNEAGAHVGTVQRVCGPLVSVRDDDHGVYLNIGHDYPNIRRFTVIFWNVAWIDPIDSGATICTTGDIINYEGVAQIHTAPENAEVWN